MATVDSLDIQIQGSAEKAAKAIDSLIEGLGKLADSLKIDTSGLDKIGSAINVSGIEKASKTIQSQMSGATKSLDKFGEKYKDLGKGFTLKGSTEYIQKQIDSLTNQLAKAKLAKEDFEKSGKTDLAGYETAVKNVIKYSNQIESLKSQLSDLQNVKPDIDFKINGIEEAAKQISDVSEKIKTVSIPESALNYNTDAMRAVFGEMAAGVENWSQAVQKFGTNAGTVFNQTSTETDELSTKTKQFEESLKSLKIPPVNTNNLEALKKQLQKTEEDHEKLKAKLENGITMGKISANVDNKAFRDLKEQMALAEKQADALRNKIKELDKTSNSTTSGVKNLSNSAKTAAGSISNLGSSSTRAIAPLNNLGSGFKRLVRTMLPIIGITQLFRFGKNAMETASDLTEVQNVVDTTFGSMAYKVDDLSSHSIGDFGMSELTAKQISGRFQAMGTAMGFSQGKMSDMSVELAKLAADMASFYNVSQNDVAKSLESIFTGTTAPLRRYGLDLTQATLQEWALKQGLDADIKSMSQAEKTMLRYHYVLANTTAAQGDFAKTADTWANSVRILKQNFEQLASVIGGTLINVFKPIVKAANAAMSSIISFAKTISNALGKIFGWTFEVSTGGVVQDFSDVGDFASGGGGGASSGTNDLADNANKIADSFDNAASASDDIADSTGQAKKNIDKMKAGLRAFDELKTINMPDMGDNDDPLGTGNNLKDNLNAWQDLDDLDDMLSGGAGGLGAGGVGGGKWVPGESILKKFESEIDSLYELGAYIGKTLADAMNSIDWDSIYEKARGFGKGLADFLNGLISPDLFGALGRTIAGALNTALYALQSFGETFDWKDFGLSIAMGINNFFATYDFVALADTLNTWAIGILDAMIEAISKTDWEMIGEKIGDFLAGIDFIEIGKKIGKLIWKAINAGFDLYAGMFKKAPLETALISLIAMPKLFKAITSSKIITGLKKISTYFADIVKAFKTGGLNGALGTFRDKLTGIQKFTIGATGVLGEFALVKTGFEELEEGSDNLLGSLGKIAGGVGVAVGALKLIGLSNPFTAVIVGATALIGAINGINDAREKAFSALVEERELSVFGEHLSEITTRLNESAQATRDRMAASMEYVQSAGVGEMQMAQDLADRYFELSEKEGLTNAETEEMKGLAEQLVQKLPGLEEFYDKQTGKIEATRKEVDKLIESRFREIQLNAISEELEGAYKERINKLKELKEATDTVSKNQEELNKMQGDYNELVSRVNAETAYEDINSLLEKGYETLDKTTASQDLLNALSKSGVEETENLVELRERLYDIATKSGTEEMLYLPQAAEKMYDLEKEYGVFLTYLDNSVNSLQNVKGAYEETEKTISDLQQMMSEGMRGEGGNFADNYAQSILEEVENVEVAAKKLGDSGTNILRESAAGAAEAGKEAGSKYAEESASGFEDSSKKNEGRITNVASSSLNSSLDPVIEQSGRIGSQTSDIYVGELSTGLTSNKSVSSIRTAAGGINNEIINKLSETVSQIQTIGVNIAEGLISGIKSKEPEISKATKGISDIVSNGVRKTLEIHSPSRVMFEIGDYTMQGFKEGMESLYNPIANSIKDFSYDVTAAPASSFADTTSYMSYRYQPMEYTPQYGIAEYQQDSYGQGNAETNTLLREVLSELRKGHIIELDDGVIAGSTRKIANNYTRSQGEPYFAI